MFITYYRFLFHFSLYSSNFYVSSTQTTTTQQIIESVPRRPSSSIEDEMTVDWTPEMPFQNVSFSNCIILV